MAGEALDTWGLLAGVGAELLTLSQVTEIGDERARCGRRMSEDARESPLEGVAPHGGACAWVDAGRLGSWPGWRSANSLPTSRR